MGMVSDTKAVVTHRHRFQLRQCCSVGQRYHLLRPVQQITCERGRLRTHNSWWAPSGKLLWEVTTIACSLKKDNILKTCCQGKMKLKPTFSTLWENMLIRFLGDNSVFLLCLKAAIIHVTCNAFMTHTCTDDIWNAIITSVQGKRWIYSIMTQLENRHSLNQNFFPPVVNMNETVQHWNNPSFILFVTFCS